MNSHRPRRIHASLSLALSLVPAAALATTPALATIAHDLGSPDPARRMRAAGAVVYLGEEASSVVAQLLPVLRDDDESVAAAAALALGSMRERATPAVGELLRLVTEQPTGTLVADAVVPARPFLVMAAVEALGRVGWQAVPAIVAAARASDDDGVRDLLELAIAGVGEPAVAELMALARTGTVRERRWAMAAIERVPQLRAGGDSRPQPEATATLR